jgi:hypothetical protein
MNLIRDLIAAARAAGNEWHRRRFRRAERARIHGEPF